MKIFKSYGQIMYQIILNNGKMLNKNLQKVEDMFIERLEGIGYQFIKETFDNGKSRAFLWTGIKCDHL